MIIIQASFVPEGGRGKGYYFSGWDRLITCSKARSVLIFKDQFHLNNVHLLYLSDP